MKGSDCLQVQDILGKDLVGDEWLTEEELRFLMSVTDEDELQLIYKKAYDVKAKICTACSVLSRTHRVFEPMHQKL